MAASTRPHTIVPTRTPRRGATGAGLGSWVVMAVVSAGVAGTVGGAPAVVGMVMVSSEWFMGRVSVSPASRAIDSVLSLCLIHISEPARVGMISYAVFCLKKKKKHNNNNIKK